ncbi:MAG: hypothetical protein EXQ52_00535 [Bryobacterales bacterium]|nr:hypothetical protein [Bryobacterales bacterium]
MMESSCVAEYRAVGKDEPVSQTAGFTFPVRGEQVSLNLYRIIETGQTHISLRHLGKTVDEKPEAAPALPEEPGS